MRRPILGFALTAVGAFFYSKRVIHADSAKDEHFYNIYTLNQRGKDYVVPTAVVGPQLVHPDVEKTLGEMTDQQMVKQQLEALSSDGYINGAETGIRRFDTISVTSSTFRPDTTLVSSDTMPSGSSWTIFSLFETDTLSNISHLPISLHAMLLNGLIDLFSKYEHSAEHSDFGTMINALEEVEEGQFEAALHQSVKQTFLDVDHLLVQRPFELLPSSTSQLPHKASFILTMNYALPGSSALVAFYDHEPHKLRVANTGKARAILGRMSSPSRSGQKMYTVHVLSEDHTSNTAPGLTRAFGFGSYKWSRDIQERLHKDFLGELPLDLSTQPILTAEPSVTTTTIQPGDFMVMASGGLWNSLTNEEAVGLVGLWLNRNMSGGQPATTEAVDPTDLPVLVGKDNTMMYKRWGIEKNFICVDNNLAAHLARNALGGANVSWTAALLCTLPPRSQYIRDDINVTVVQFDIKP